MRIESGWAIEEDKYEQRLLLYYFYYWAEENASSEVARDKIGPWALTENGSQV